MRAVITGKSKILGLIADPVSQARTPVMANAILEECGLFGSYVLLPMHVSAEGFPVFLAGLRSLKNFAGAVVSMPHKVATAELIDELSAEASLVGAVNVVRRNSDGRLVGTMLDGEGFVSGLKTCGHEISGAHILLTGAGGAASAIAFALAKYGCGSLCIQNRTNGRAVDLAARVSRAFPRVPISTQDDPSSHYSIVINGTSLGMKPEDELPIPVSAIKRCNVVAECVVAPEITPLLQLASREGKAIHTGVPMLAAQLNLMLAFMGAK